MQSNTVADFLQALDNTIKSEGENKPTLSRGNSTQSVSREDKVPVWLRVVFVKIGEIDTVKERFEADAFVQAKWREPQLDGQSRNTEQELVNYGSIWDPKLFIENVAGEFKETMWYMVSYNDKGEATVCQRRRVKGVFNEIMELEQYPFDTQDLTLTISTSRGEQELVIGEDTSEVSSVSVQSFVHEQEWCLHRHVNSTQRVTTNAYSNTRYKHPALAMSIKASRKNGFFVWNITLIMCLICSLVFTTFTVNIAKPENRLQLSFILLLSNITFKLAVNSTTPKVSYLTYLDKYILASMIILCLVCVWHAIVAQLALYLETKTVKQADIIAFSALLAAYIGFNIIYFATIKLLVYRKHKEFKQRDLHQKFKAKAMLGLHLKDSKSCLISSSPQVSPA